MIPGEDPKLFFARLDKVINTLKSVGIHKAEQEIVQILKRNLSAEYMTELRSLGTQPGRFLSRPELESIVRNSYADRKTRQLDQPQPQPSPHPQLHGTGGDPHALFVGGGTRGGNGHRRPGRGGGGGRGPIPQQPRHSSRTIGHIHNGLATLRSSPHLSINVFHNSGSTYNNKGFHRSRSRSSMFVNNNNVNNSLLSSAPRLHNALYSALALTRFRTRVLPDGAWGGFTTVALMLRAGFRRNRPHRLEHPWVLCPNVGAAGDSVMWPTFALPRRGSRTSVTAVASMATSATTALFIAQVGLIPTPTS